MANPERPDDSGPAFPLDGEARADAIDERIERLRRLHGWASDTKVVSKQEVEAVVEAVDGAFAPHKGPEANLTLRFSHPTTGEKTVVVDLDHYDIGSGEKAKLRILDPSLSARHVRLYRDGDGYRVRDMNTQTGTWVNDERVPLSAALSDGDRLRCGEVLFEVSLHIPGASEGPAADADDDGPEHTLAVGPDGNSMGRQSLADRVRAHNHAAAAPAPAPVEPAPVAEARSPSPSDDGRGGKAAPGARVALAGAASSCFLVYYDGNGDEQEVEVPKDKPLVIGRKSSSDLRLTDHGISSVHATFEWVDGQVVVRDLGSTNGTWVHGERVPRAVLTDQDVVRLGLVPIRVCLVGGGHVVEVPMPAPAAVVVNPSTGSHPRPKQVTPIHDIGQPPWHLVYVDDQGALDVFTLDAREACIVAGSDPVEIQFTTRDLRGEHLQFDWIEGKLTVMKAHRDADLKVNDAMVAESSVENGDVVTASGIVFRVVRGASLEHAPMVLATNPVDRAQWTQRFRDAARDLELLFIDPEAAGGRAELSVWGDGVVQVDLRAGDRHERTPATITARVLRVLFDTFEMAGFPDLPDGVSPSGAAGPELCAFFAESRAALVIDDKAAAHSEPWRSGRDLLRAIVDFITP